MSERGACYEPAIRGSRSILGYTETGKVSQTGQSGVMHSVQMNFAAANPEVLLSSAMYVK